MTTSIKHTCHARGCNTAVPPRMLMCKRHWYMVPYDLRQEVWEEYVPGQEISKTPTPEYLDVAQKAVLEVARKEGLA